MLRHWSAPKRSESVADALGPDGVDGWAAVRCCAVPGIERRAVRTSAVLVARMRSRVDDIGCRVAGVVRGAGMAAAPAKERWRGCGQARKTIAAADWRTRTVACTFGRRR